MRKSKSKKRTMGKIITAFVMLSIIFSCTKEEELPNLGKLEIQLKLAEGLKNIPLSNLPIKLVNTVDNSESEKTTDTNGKVIFENLPVGTYTVSLIKKTDDYALNAIATNINIIKQKTTEKIVEINATNPNGGLVIKEVYSVGAGDGYISLFKDQFIEIFNNSSETIYADGLYIANLYGETGDDTSESHITEVLDIKDYVYANFIDQIPGTGKNYPVESGKSIVIALNAINFKEKNPKPDKAIDNTDATLERYSVEWLESKGIAGNKFFDFDNPSVPNMTNIYLSPPSNIYLFNTYGTGVVLVSKDVTFTEKDVIDYKKPGQTRITKLMKIPVKKVTDGVDILENSQAVKYKRLPASIDAGFHYLKADGNAFYTGMSSQRKKDKAASARFGRVVLQDTNNSSVDFEALSKTNKYGYNK